MRSVALQGFLLLAFGLGNSVALGQFPGPIDPDDGNPDDGPPSIDLPAGPGPVGLCYFAEPDAEEIYSCHVTDSREVHDPVPVHNWTGTVGSAGSAKLSDQLASALSGPDGDKWSQLLAPYLTGGVPQRVGLLPSGDPVITQEASELFEAEDDYDVSGNPDTADFIPAGSTYRIYTTVTTTTLVETFEGSANLDPRAASALSGDLHTIAPSVLIEASETFLGAMLDGGGMTGIPALFAQTPMAFAPVAMDAPALDALAYMAATPAPRAPGWTGWIGASGMRLDRGGDDDNFGWAATGGSIEGGVRYTDGPMELGLAAGFGSSRIVQDETGDTVNADSLLVGAHARYDVGEWIVRGGVALGYHALQTRRIGFGPAEASAEYDAQTFTAGIEASRPMLLGAFDFEPFGGAVYSLARTGSFTETGSEFFDLYADGAGSSRFTLYGGARISAQYRLASGAHIRPEARARIGVDLADDPHHFDAVFVTDVDAERFGIAGAGTDRLSGSLGAGVEMTMANGLTGRIDYDAIIAAGALAHRFSAVLAYRW